MSFKDTWISTSENHVKLNSTDCSLMDILNFALLCAASVMLLQPESLDRNRSMSRLRLDISDHFRVVVILTPWFLFMDLKLLKPSFLLKMENEWEHHWSAIRGKGVLQDFKHMDEVTLMHSLHLQHISTHNHTRSDYHINFCCQFKIIDIDDAHCWSWVEEMCIGDIPPQHEYAKASYVSEFWH